MSLARQHRDRILAQQAASAPASEGGLATIGELAARHANTAQAQIMLRLTHDLRRLKEIQSIERKIEAKREMLPEYFAWVDGLLAAARETGQGVADEVLPTIMIWAIDTGDFDRALPLAEYVLRYNVPLPTRYERSAPALIAEEVATAAIKAQAAGEVFPLAILDEVDTLTAVHDMHDEIRAKLMKAIGFELARQAEELDAATPEFAAAAARALEPLRRAQQLHDRIGTKTRIQQLEKALAKVPAPAAPEQAGAAG